MHHVTASTMAYEWSRKAGGSSSSAICVAAAKLEGSEPT